MNEGDRPILSICLRCRDGREAERGDVRGGTRLARAILAQAGAQTVSLRGVNCLSQCKRSCTVALSGPGRFTYVFGDLDPEATGHPAAVLAVAAFYAAAPEGFLARKDRPAPLRAGILGRVPPVASASDLIVPLAPVAAE